MSTSYKSSNSKGENWNYFKNWKHHCHVDCDVCGDRGQRKEAYVYDDKKYRRWSQHKE